MPDTEELLRGARAVTALEHTWFRSVIGMMCYYAVQARWVIALEVNRAAQSLEIPTQGALAGRVAAARRIMACLVGTWES